MRSEAEAALAQAEALLQAQAQALRTGDADALPSLAAALRAPLSVLARHARAGLPAALRPRLQALRAQAVQAQVIAQRRAQVVQGALDALGQGEGRLQAARLAGTYGRTGGLQSGWRSAGCETA
jgi:hypothetical protein